MTKSKAFGAAEEWEAGSLTDERAESLTVRFHAHSLSAALGCAQLLPVSSLGITKLLDVGGGSGCYTIALAKANPTLKGDILDLPQVQNTRNIALISWINSFLVPLCVSIVSSSLFIICLFVLSVNVRCAR